MLIIIFWRDLHMFEFLDGDLSIHSMGCLGLMFKLSVILKVTVSLVIDDSRG